MTVGSCRGAPRRGAWIAALVLSSACQKSAAPSASPDTPATTQSPDPLAAVRAELAGNAAELQALGVVVGGPKKRPEEKRDLDDGGRATAESAGDGPESDEVKSSRPEPESPPKAEPNNAPAPTKATTTATLDSCGRICGLAGVACDLSQRICTLAEQHDGDARYEDLCWNAQRQCEDASDACADCSTC